MIDAADYVTDAIDAVAQSLPANAPLVAFHGKRPGDRPVAFTARCALVETDALSQPDASAPSDERFFTAYIAKAAWLDETPPQIGEWAELDLPGELAPVWCKVASVSRLATGDYRLLISWLPKRQGGPSW